VASGQPAEVVHSALTIEGGLIVELFRYTGSGPVIEYVDTSDDAWSDRNWLRFEGDLTVTDDYHLVVDAIPTVVD